MRIIPCCGLRSQHKLVTASHPHYVHNKIGKMYTFCRRQNSTTTAVSVETERAFSHMHTIIFVSLQESKSLSRHISRGCGDLCARRGLTGEGGANNSIVYPPAVIPHDLIPVVLCYTSALPMQRYYAPSTQSSTSTEEKNTPLS